METTTYLKLENVVDLLEFLLVPVLEKHKSALQLLVIPMALNGSPSFLHDSMPARLYSPSLDLSYLAVNSSKVSSACASLLRIADCEKARWVFNATGVAR